MAGDAQQKSALRQQWRARRDQTSVSQRNRASQRLSRHLIGMAPWQDAAIVASFIAYGSEIDLAPIDTIARKAGKQVAYPRVGTGRDLTFHLWQPGDPSSKSRLGVIEPLPEAPQVTHESIDFLWVPLLACDDNGIRLGYGGGFYDRVLDINKGVACGVGYSWQRCHRLPEEAHDQRVQGYLSDQAIEWFDAIDRD